MSEDQTLRVQGMTCTGCENRITGALGGVDGVVAATADHEQDTVALVHDSTPATGGAVHQAIEELGYRVVT